MTQATSWQLPPRVPQRRRPIFARLCRLTLRLMGWRVRLDEFPNVPKAMFIAAPHSSNWDFVVLILVVYSLGLHASWLGKHTLFKGPLGKLFYAMGGIPVDRSAPEGVVEQIVAEYRRRDAMFFALAPQGTRRASAPFRRGYHRIARGADVPLLLAAIDYPSRTVAAGMTFELTDDAESDTQKLEAYYRQFQGRNPD